MIVLRTAVVTWAKVLGVILGVWLLVGVVGPLLTGAFPFTVESILVLLGYGAFSLGFWGVVVYVVGLALISVTWLVQRIFARHSSVQ